MVILNEIDFLYWLATAQLTFTFLTSALIYRVALKRQRTCRFKRLMPVNNPNTTSVVLDEYLIKARDTKPNIKSQRKPEWVLHETLRLKVLMGHAGCRKIAITFNRLHGNTCTIGKSYMAMSIKQHQYTLQALRREMRAQLPQALPVNHTWAMDLSFVADENKSQHTVLGTIDHGSR